MKNINTPEPDASSEGLESIDDAKISQIIEEFENESQTRKLSGIWLAAAGVLAAFVSIYALYWTQYSVTTQVYRATFLALVLVLSFFLYPIGLKKWGKWVVGIGGAVTAALIFVYVITNFPRANAAELIPIALVLITMGAGFGLYPFVRQNPSRVSIYDIVLAGLALISLVYLVQNYQAALQRIVNPTPMEIVMGIALMLLSLEATRRTTGPALPLTAIFFLIYAVAGAVFPEPFDHRGYKIDRIVGQNYLTLEGIFGVPLDVASSFIVLFTIYGAMLEYSGAGKFFLDWAFSALGKSNSGAGPGRTVTAAGFLLGTVSGSGVATTVTLGALAWPMLKKAGYSKEVAGGVLSAAGIGATLSPPTLGAAAFLIAEYLDISYLEVLVYAAIPTILYYLSALLMVEADSRRLKTKAVEAHVLSLRQLTLRYGYHFSSLFAVAILMAIGMTPFMAVFWSIMIAFILSFIQPETRLTSFKGLLAGVVVAIGLVLTGLVPSDRLSNAVYWGLMAAALFSLGSWLYNKYRGTSLNPIPPLLRALESGGKGVVSIAATTAVAGIIVSVVTLTGLGLKISGQIVDLSGGNILATIVLAAVAVWVLGLAVPVTASYIIAAVMIVPALTKVGVPEPAAHMFIFYYAVLSDVTPPTALAPSAAAALTGGKPYPTMLLAWKYCLPGFLVPIMFTISKEGSSILLGNLGPNGLIFFTDPMNTLWTFITACVAVAMLAACFGGWIYRAANMFERILMGAGGLLLLYADYRTDILGFLLLVFALVMHILRLRKPSLIGA